MQNQVSETQWNEIASPICLAIVPFLPGELTEKLGISFSSTHENGLGECLYAFVEINGVISILKAFPEGPYEAQRVSVWVRSFEVNWEPVFTGLREWGIEFEDLLFIQKDLKPAQWLLLRLDDNSNEIEMFRFVDEYSAKFVQAQYETKGHKQTYLVRQNA